MDTDVSQVEEGIIIFVMIEYTILLNRLYYQLLISFENFVFYGMF